MRVMYYRNEPFFVLNYKDFLTDLVRVRKNVKYDAKKLEFIKYNASLSKKMANHIGLKKNPRYSHITALSMFFNDILLDVLKDVYRNNKIAIFRNYKISKRIIPIDEEFLKSKQEAHKSLMYVKKNRKVKVNLVNNDVSRRKSKFYQFERIYLEDIRNEKFIIQLFFKYYVDTKAYKKKSN